MQPVDVASLPILPPVMMKRSVMKVTKAVAKKEEEQKIVTLGGAAAKLLPESVKEDAKDEKSATPLLSDND
jgi:hypothetical protein